MLSIANSIAIIRRQLASPEKIGTLHRLFAAASDAPDAPNKAAESGRYGSKLLKMGKVDQYARMQTILGARTAPKQPIKTVTISILQSIKHLNLDKAYKMKLAGYRVGQLGKQLFPLIAKSELSVTDGKAAKRN
jgi:hypothetical protein